MLSAEVFIDWRLSIVGHRYDGQPSVSRNAAIINHEGTRVHSRVLGVFAAEFRGNTTDMGANQGDKGGELELNSCDAW